MAVLDLIASRARLVRVRRSATGPRSTRCSACRLRQARPAHGGEPRGDAPPRGAASPSRYDGRAGVRDAAAGDTRRPHSSSWAATAPPRCAAPPGSAWACSTRAATPRSTRSTRAPAPRYGTQPQASPQPTGDMPYVVLVGGGPGALRGRELGPLPAPRRADVQRGLDGRERGDQQVGGEERGRAPQRNGPYRIFSPQQAVAQIRKSGILLLQPLAGGIPPKLAWPSPKAARGEGAARREGGRLTVSPRAMRWLLWLAALALLPVPIVGIGSGRVPPLHHLRARLCSSLAFTLPRGVAGHRRAAVGAVPRLRR